MLTYALVRSDVAIRAKLQESRLKERLSLCLRAIAPFRVVKMRRCSLRSSFLGNYREAHSFSLRVAMAFAIVFFDRGSFAHLIEISPSANWGIGRQLALQIQLLYKRFSAEVSAGKSPPKRASAGHAATKARGGIPLRACFDFNLSSLSRARKFWRTVPAKIFGAIP